MPEMRSFRDLFMPVVHADRKFANRKDTSRHFRPRFNSTVQNRSDKNLDSTKIIQVSRAFEFPAHFGVIGPKSIT